MLKVGDKVRFKANFTPFEQGSMLSNAKMFDNCGIDGGSIYIIESISVSIGEIFCRLSGVKDDMYLSRLELAPRAKLRRKVYPRT